MLSLLFMFFLGRKGRFHYRNDYLGQRSKTTIPYFYAREFIFILIKHFICNFLFSLLFGCLFLVQKTAKAQYFSFLHAILVHNTIFFLIVEDGRNESRTDDIFRCNYLKYDITLKELLLSSFFFFTFTFVFFLFSIFFYVF